MLSILLIHPDILDVVINIQIVIELCQTLDVEKTWGKTGVWINNVVNNYQSCYDVCVLGVWEIIYKRMYIRFALSWSSTVRSHLALCKRHWHLKRQNKTATRKSNPAQQCTPRSFRGIFMDAVRWGIITIYCYPPLRMGSFISLIDTPASIQNHYQT